MNFESASREYRKKITEALSAASHIAESADSDPSRYVRPMVNAWDNLYLGSDRSGYFMKFTNVLRETLNIQIDSLNYPKLSFVAATFTGDASDSKAVFNGIERIKISTNEFRTVVAFNEVQLAYNNGSASQAKEILDTFFVRNLGMLVNLHHTMLTKMEQGKLSDPVAGPNEVIIETPFGPVKVSRGKEPITNMTRSELVSLIHDAVSNSIKDLLMNFR